MPTRSTPVVLDDRLLIEELLTGPGAEEVDLQTTTHWFYRACRAAVLGAGGHLSGPFARLDSTLQERAVLALLEPSDHISLPDPRTTVPAMVEMAGRHPRLNPLNLEAVAVGRLGSATMWLSAETAAGVLPDVLDAEGVAWQTVPLA